MNVGAKDNKYRMRPQTASFDYNHLLYERAVKKNVRYRDENL